MVSFKIVSSRTVESLENEKKYVTYMIRVSNGYRDNTLQENERGCNAYVADNDPAEVERRYTHFLDLYNGLKKDFPSFMNNLSFPRKIVMGNFDAALITARCKAFQSLLDLVAAESQMRNSQAAIAFFRDVELSEAKKFLSEEKYDQALTILELSFKLLNKVYTDRSRVVLCALCRVVACAGASGGALAGPVERWAQLALRRYQAVSDDDLLLIYIPLLHAAISVWDTLGRDKTDLVKELNDLRKRGMKVDSVPSLMDAVDSFHYTS